MKENGIKKGDVVIAVTEGGETSSVIGTIRAAVKEYDAHEDSLARENLYFIFNNPVDVLMPFERSRIVLEDDRITKIPLWTGPQAIGGSTRMQASTSEQYVISILIEDALTKTLLDAGLNEEELNSLGFDKELTIKDRLL